MLFDMTDVVITSVIVLTSVIVGFTLGDQRYKRVRTIERDRERDLNREDSGYEHGKLIP